MWKHKTLNFTVLDVIFYEGWAMFISSGIPCTMKEASFKEHYEKC